MTLTYELRVCAPGDDPLGVATWDDQVESRPRGLQLETESQWLGGSHAVPYARALAPLRSVAVLGSLVVLDEAWESSQFQNHGIRSPLLFRNEVPVGV